MSTGEADNKTQDDRESIRGCDESDDSLHGL